VAELVTGVAQSLLPAIPNRACLRGSRRAPIDAGLANASDTSYIYEVLDSHPSFPISQPQSRPVGRKVAAQPLWAGCHTPLCGRRLNCASSDWPLSGRWRW
jgi:hypothetical protein